MVTITYSGLLLFLAAAWLLCRILVFIKTREVDLKRECRLLTVLICLAVVSRFVYFPLRRVNGEIQPLVFDAAKILPFRVNLVPFVHLFDRYDGWLINIIGNIAMFIPVGICWPLCFRKLDRIGKTVLAGFGLSLFIELSQLLFYDRYTDIDDLLMNTAGAFLGAVIYFLTKRRR